MRTWIHRIDEKRINAPQALCLRCSYVQGGVRNISANAERRPHGDQGKKQSLIDFKEQARAWKFPG